MILIGNYIGANKEAQPRFDLIITCDSIAITCDSDENLLVNGQATTIREQFNSANEKMTILYNNILN